MLKYSKRFRFYKISVGVLRPYLETSLDSDIKKCKIGLTSFMKSPLKKNAFNLSVLNGQKKLSVFNKDSRTSKLVTFYSF